MEEMIYQLIPKAMKMVGAIGKDSVNKTQGFKYRGIDAVYNALNPVMSELGLFIIPEILDHRREERESEKTYNGQTQKTLLKYSILTIKYTMYAPDGSNVSCVVVGEGMDSGDKASNKAMSVALKYACFQLFMIPTEEMIDPDQESFDVTSGAKEPGKPKETQQERLKQAQNPPVNATMTNVSTVPSVAQNPQQTPSNPVLDYLANERQSLMASRRINKAENAAIWRKQIEALIAAGMIANKPLAEYTMKEAQTLINLMYTRFAPTGTELIPVDGETA